MGESKFIRLYGELTRLRDKNSALHTKLKDAEDALTKETKRRAEFEDVIKYNKVSALRENLKAQDSTIAEMRKEIDRLKNPFKGDEWQWEFLADLSVEDRAKVLHVCAEIYAKDKEIMRSRDALIKIHESTDCDKAHSIAHNFFENTIGTRKA